mmetsp:Transcript_32632/g.86105  ORF Transcript_32632/g.86105 Transcript_32632/m.86105 type:complete len:100 (+) Transcript_32632:2074-2373(+)
MANDWFSEAVVPILAEELQAAVRPEVLGEIIASESAGGSELGLNNPLKAPEVQPGCWARLFGKKKDKKGRVAPSVPESENVINVKARELAAAGSGGHGA